MAPKVNNKMKELSSDSSSSDDEPTVEAVIPEVVAAVETKEETPKAIDEVKERPAYRKQPQHQQPFNRFPKRHFTTPTDNSQSRTEIKKAVTNMYGSGCKGKKFRKEKGKKKRSQYSGARIDGAVKSVRLDA